MSLAEQRLAPRELIASDDGSSDSTVAILEEFAAEAPFPVVVCRNTSRLGFANNFLQAAERATAPLIAFSDHDDVWYPRKLELAVDFFDKNPATQVLIHGMVTVDEDLRPLTDGYPAIPREGSDPDPWLIVPGIAMVFAAELLHKFDWRRRPPSRDLDGPEHLMDHDEWLYLLGLNAGAVGFLREPLVSYRQHASNASGAPRRWSPRQNLARLLADDFSTQRNRTAVARAYQELAERSRADGTGATEASVEYWRRYRELSELRDRIYASRSRPRRVLLLGRLLLAGGYRNRTHMLGWRALARDLRAVLEQS